MKLSSVLEDADVIDFGKRKQQQQAEVHDKQNTSVEDVRSDLDHAVAGGIDFLKGQGFEDRAAETIVMSHLSDLVMAHDLSK